MNSALRCCLLVFFQMFLLLACTPARQTKPVLPAIVIDGVILWNELAFPVTDVQVLVPSSGNFVGCGTILPRSACSTTFPVRDYYENEVVVTWKEYGTAHSTGEFVLEVPETFDRSRTAQLEVRIFMMGEAGARLVQ